MLAYLMQFTALFNAVCLYNACLFFAIDFCIAIYTSAFLLHALSLSFWQFFISIIILHHVQWFKLVSFLDFMLTMFFVNETTMRSLEK